MKVAIALSLLAATTVSADSFSTEDQAIWIDRHNYFRTTGLPWSAGNMRRVGWAADLATKAASTAAKCSATTTAGVNVFQSSSTNSTSILDEAIQQWVVETSMSTLSTLKQPGASGEDVGTGVYNSYSQVLWSSTTSIGCATASCSGGDMVVCQYSPAGNDGSSAWYVHANTASDCPSGTTASEGLCIVQGDAANNQIAAIAAGKLTYEVYPAYVADMQTVLIEAARAIAKGSGTSTSSGASSKTTTAPSPTTATPKTATVTPTATTAKPSSKTSSSSANSSSTSSKKTTSPSTGESSSSTKKSTTTSSSGADSSTSVKQSSKTTSSASDDSSSPGTVKASSDSGSTFTNQAKSSDSTAQTPSSGATTPSTDSTTASTKTESATPSATTSASTGSSAAISANNKSSTSGGSGISATGVAGMVMLAVVAIATVGVVVSYRKNQKRQREIMRDGGIRII